MTEAKPMDPERIALVRQRIGALLAEQPGAMEAYDTGMQVLPATSWWDAKSNRLTNPQLAMTLAKHFPVQPLAAQLAEFLRVASGAYAIAQRPKEYERWLNPEQIGRLAKGSNRSSESIQKMRAVFSTLENDAESRLRHALTHLEQAAALYQEAAENLLESSREIYNPELIAEDAHFERAQLARAALQTLVAFAEQIRKRDPDEVGVPRSLSEWKTFETEMGARLQDLGVGTDRVVDILISGDGHADPIDEANRIRRNLSRFRSKR